MHFVLSDLHLIDQERKYLFDRNKERVFVELCALVRDTRSRLVLAGDIFDVTGLTPCPVGHELFFHEGVPSHALSPLWAAKCSRARTHEEILDSIRAVFPDFFTALAELARSGSLIYIPGNHDCLFLKEDEQKIFENILGVERGRIKWMRHLHLKDLLLVAHGNEYDPSNQTDHGCANPGRIFTSALYQGVIPALRMLGLKDDVVDAILAVRPEENVVRGLEHHLGEKECNRMLLAFARLLQRNGFFKGVSAVPAWFLAHDVPFVSRIFREGVTPKRIRGLLPKEERLKIDARRGARRLRKKLPAKIVVFGHTHEFDLEKTYVNTGTWIDHVRGLAPFELSTPEKMLPLFVISDTGAAAVYDLKGWVHGSSFSDLKPLWRSEGEL